MVERNFYFLYRLSSLRHSLTKNTANFHEGDDKSDTDNKIHKILDTSLTVDPMEVER